MALLCHASPTYFVIPTTGNKSCPVDKECHEFSYYNQNISLPSNVTFIFLNGEHEIDEKSSIHINSLNEVNLIGQGQWVHSFHWSVMQSTVIIRCTHNKTTAINIYNTTSVYIEGLTIADCGYGVFINTSSNVDINSLSVQNNSVLGLVIVSAVYVNLKDSSFYQNGHKKYSGNAILLNVVGISNIKWCNFTMGKGSKVGGLSVVRQNNMKSPFNTTTIDIYGCLFYANNGRSVGGAQVLKISDIGLTIIIQNSNFLSNSGGTGGLRISTNGKGGLNIKINALRFSCNNGDSNTGGAFLGIYDDSNKSVNLENVTFYNNNGFIGGLTIFTGGHWHSNVKISHSKLLFNIGNDRRGGGLCVYMVSGRVFTPPTLTIQNTVFTNNSDVSAGAMFITSNGHVNITDVNVTNTTNSHFVSSKLSNAFGAIKLVCDTSGQTVHLTNVCITNNNTKGLFIKRCAVNFTKSSSIIASNQSPSNGGGIYADAATVMTSTVTVFFINNSAQQYGGAIYSNADYIKPVGLFKLPNIIQHCTFSYFYANFSKNNAMIAGNDIFGGNFYFTFIQSDYSVWTPSFIDVFKCTISDIFYGCLTNSLSYSHISSKPIGVCSCDNDGYIDCSKRILYKDVYPGDVITLSLVTVGMCDSISPGVLLTESDGVDVTLNEDSQKTKSSCSNFTYILKDTYASHIGLITIRTSGTPQLDGSKLKVSIKFLPCPVGLQYYNLSGECHCDDAINSLKPQCNVSWMPYPIRRSGNNWLSYHQEYECIMALTNCPLKYCNPSVLSLSLNNSDLQCMYNRSGILCGKCKEGMSVLLGSNKCEICSNIYLTTILAFILAGIIVVLFLLTINMTVSMGTINGLLFYVNIVKLNETVFFPDGNVPVLTQFVAWLNLDLGIETCFFNGLDNYWKTWLQFVFPLYIWLLIGGIIIGCHYYGRLSRLCGNNAVPVLATLILMSYSKIMRNITSALLMRKVNCGQHKWNVWSLDGNINYLSNKHVPLVIVSLLFLLLGLLLTGLIFCSQWLQRYSGKCCRGSRDPVVKLKPFIDAFCGPFKDNFRFWPGLLLVVRIIITAIFSYTTGSLVILNNYIIIIGVGFLLIAGNGVYRDRRLMILEFFYFINLGLMSTLNAISNDFNLAIESTVSIVSVSLASTSFMGIIIIHVYLLIKTKRRFHIISCPTKHQPLHEESTDDKSVELFSPPRVINKRESLIFDFFIDM